MEAARVTAILAGPQRLQIVEEVIAHRTEEVLRLVVVGNAQQQHLGGDGTPAVTTDRRCGDWGLIAHDSEGNSAALAIRRWSRSMINPLRFNIPT